MASTCLWRMHREWRPPEELPCAGCTYTRTHLHEEPAEASLGWWISQITTQQHWSSLPFRSLSLCAVNRYIWNMVCLHSCSMVNGWSSLFSECANLHHKSKWLLLTWHHFLSSFGLGFHSFWLEILKKTSVFMWQNVNLVKNTLALSVLFTDNLVTSCCCCDFAVNQPFWGFVPCMKGIRPNTVEPITSFVQTKW